MSASSQTFRDEIALVAGSANSCDFVKCPVVTIAGSSNSCTFIDCAVVTIGGSCNSSEFINCPTIKVGGNISSSTRDGSPYRKPGATNSINLGGGGNFTTFLGSSGRTYGGSVSISNVSSGSVVINGKKYSGGGSMINNVWIPASLGFTESGGKADGRIYGRKSNGIWYVFDSTRGSSENPDNWIEYRPKEYDDVPHVIRRNEDSSAPPPPPGTYLYNCIQCHKPNPKFKDTLQKRFCSKECQKALYSGQ